MTYVFTKISGLPENQVIGSGTLLDTARLRFGLSEHFHVAQKNIHAYVFGEHGDTSFIPWSCADVSGAGLDDYAEKKGATFYAVSVSVCKLCEILLSAYDSIVTVSSVLHGEYGIEDVALSTLTLVGPQGVQGKIPVKLTEEEVEKLKKSADSLKEVISQIEL